VLAALLAMPGIAEEVPGPLARGERDPGALQQLRAVSAPAHVSPPQERLSDVHAELSCPAYFTGPKRSWANSSVAWAAAF
jgi:hypothetical protein